jgi:hypothetical protein
MGKWKSPNIKVGTKNVLMPDILHPLIEVIAWVMEDMISEEFKNRFKMIYDVVKEFILTSLS